MTSRYLLTYHNNMYSTMKRYYSLFLAAAALVLLPAALQAQTSNNSAPYAKSYAATSSSQAATVGDAFVLTDAAGDTVLYAAPSGEVVAGNPGGFAGSGEGLVSIMERPGGPSAGLFQTLNPENLGVNLFSMTYGQGPAGAFYQLNDTTQAASLIGLTYGRGSAGTFDIWNAGNAATALRAATNGTGQAGSFHISNTASTSTALSVTTEGNGAGLHVRRSGQSGDYGPAIDAYQNGSGGWAPALSAHIDNVGNDSPVIDAFTAGLGPAGNFHIGNTSSNTTALQASTNGTGQAGSFNISNSTNTHSALAATTDGIGSSIHARRSGVGGEYGPVIEALQEGNAGFAPAIHAQIVNVDNPAPVVEAYTTGLGPAGSFTVENSSNNIAALEARTNGTGSAGYFEVSDSTSQAVAVAVYNRGNGPALEVNKEGSGDIAVFAHKGDYRMVVTQDGNVYADGTFQGGGADVAEAFDVEGAVASYTPGDVLVISTRSDRTVERSQEPYSTLVAGVYATKPGLLLSEKGLKTDMNTRVPMGVVGVLPTKVTLEGGVIERGDLLVTSSTPGAAMKADPARVQLGQVLGKALQSYDGEGEAVIKVLVSVR